MISGLFLARPRLAMVVSIVISLIGLLALLALPVQQYPEITPPTVSVSAVYPGASAEVIADVVGGPLETAINGVDDMLYMSSTSSNAGQYSLSITFAVGTELQLGALIGRLQSVFSTIPDANVAVFAPPAIPGIGAVGGLDLRLQALRGQPPEQIAQVLRSLLAAVNQAPEIGGMSSTFSADVPQIFVDVDRARAENLGLSVGQIYATLGAHFGSRYVNDFTLQGRVYQVNLQADADFRNEAEDIPNLFVVLQGLTERVSGWRMRRAAASEPDASEPD